MTDNITYCHYLAGGGLLLLARQQWRTAFDEFVELGRRLEDCHAWGPARIAWRSHAALSAMGRGDRDTAIRLAEEEVQLASAYGAARPLAIALRAAGLVAGGDDAIELLQRAVETLEGRGIDLEHARAGQWSSWAYYYIGAALLAKPENSCKAASTWPYGAGPRP